MENLNYNYDLFTEYDLDLINLHKKFSAVVSEIYEIDFPSVSKQSLNQLHKIDFEKKKLIVTSLETILAWQEFKPTGFCEKAFLKKALLTYKFKVHDDFWTQYNDDQIIEIYSTDMSQTFRSLNFFKVCGYSLLDLSTFEWQILFERPTSVIDNMHKYVVAAFTGIDGVMPVDIPNHLIKENFNSGLTETFIPRTCLVEFKNIGSTYDTTTNNVAGLIVSSKANLVSKNSTLNENVAFL